jgi:hypothetical protein
MSYILTEAAIRHLKTNSLPKNAHPAHKLAEGLAFADVAKDMSREALIQIAGLGKNISKVAAIALVHNYCNLN